MAGYNRTRYVEELLEKTDALPPSFSVHLHPEYWTLNNGSKFLYNNQIASLLDDIRAHRIPVDFLELFEAARVPFYDGCMIVELLDYRPQRNNEPTLEKPERTRAVLHPNAETLWADIYSLNKKYGGKWSDEDALELEARLLLAISPPLCLDPNPHLTRIANHVMRVSTPTVPVSLKRKAAAMDPEEDETDKARRAKIMQFMNPRHNMTYTPSYRLLDVLQAARQPKSGTPHPPLNGTQFIANSQQSSPMKPSTPSETSLADSDEKKTKLKKGDTPQTSFVTSAFVRANGSHTPVTVPATATHQFISQNPTSMNPSPSPGTSPMQPQVYPNVQAATEAAMRTPTPAQQHYVQPSRPPSSQPPTSSHPTPQPQPLHLAPLPQLQPQPQPQPMYIPNQPFATSPLAGTRNGSVSPSKAGNNPNSNSNPAESTPNPMTMPQHANSQALAQAMYSQQMQHLQLVQVMSQQRGNAGSGGRSTPNHSHTHTPLQSQSQLQPQGQAPSPARSSPRATSKPLGGVGGTRRSPLPPNAQLPAPHPQQAPPLQLPQHLSQQQHLALAQYNAHMRPGIHTGPGSSPHPQAMSPHMGNAKGSGSGIRRPGTASPLPPTPDGPQQLQLHLQQQPQPQQLHHGYPAHMYTYAQAQNFAAHAQAQAQAQAQGRAAGYWPMGMTGRPGMMGVGVGGQGMMGPGQPAVIGPGKAGAGVSGR